MIAHLGTELNTLTSAFINSDKPTVHSGSSIEAPNFSWEPYCAYTKCWDLYKGHYTVDDEEIGEGLDTVAVWL